MIANPDTTKAGTIQTIQPRAATPAARRRRPIPQRLAYNPVTAVDFTHHLASRASGDVDDFSNRSWPYSTDYVTPVSVLHGDSAKKIAAEAALQLGIVLTAGVAAAAPLLIADAIQILAGN